MSKQRLNGSCMSWKICYAGTETNNVNSIHLDAYARRHQAQKIFLRQKAVQRWCEHRENVLRGARPHPENNAQLAGLDLQLRSVSVFNIISKRSMGLELMFYRSFQVSPMNLSTPTCSLEIINRDNGLWKIPLSTGF